MKLFVSLFLLAILSLSLLLSGCAEPEPVPTPNTGHGDRPFMNDFRYDTVEELSGGLTSYFTEDVLQDYEDHYGPERGGVFRSFITNLQNGSVPLYVPTYLGEEIEYPNEEGRSNISLFPSDLYSKPWIWFASNEYGVNCIYTMYLDELTKEHFNENGIHGLYEELNTNGVGGQYDDIKDQTITLSNRVVSGLSCTYKKDTRTFTYFVYDDILVLLNTYGTPSESWTKDLSFEKIYLND